MASNPVVNTLTFQGNVAGQASIQAQGIAGGLTFLLPNLVPIQGQLLNVVSVNGNSVFLGFASSQSLNNIPLSALAQSGATTGEFIAWSGSAWVPSSFVPGSGTVTSVALTAPAEFTVGGSPITTSGTLAITKANQSANTVWAGPTTGAAAPPAFRALVAADIPALSALSGALSVSQINSKRGNGGFVQLAASGTAGAAGNVVTFDANGNTVDSAVLLSSLAPLASPTFTGLVTLPVAASTTGLTMLSDNNQINSTNAPIVLSSATAVNPQVITITPNSFFGPQIQFTGQNAPYTVGRLVEIGAQGLYLSNAGFAINGNLGTAGQVLTSGGVNADGGPNSLVWVSNIAGNAASITGSITESQVTNLVSDLAAKAPLASPTFTGTVVLPSTVNATGGSDLIFANTGANKIRIATATGVFDFFGTGGGMTLGSQNSQVAIDASGNISLSATGGSNLSVNSAGGLVTSSDFKPTNLFSFPGNTSGNAGQLFSSLGSDTGTAWISQSSLAITGGQITDRRTIRVPFTPSPTDVTNEYTNIAVVFSSPFADANYTLTTDLEWDTSSTPVWQANHVYNNGDFIVDSNGMLQIVTAGGTSGGTVPVWATNPTPGTTTDGGVTWTLNPVSEFNFIGVAKAKTAAGFTEECFVGVAVPMILHVTAWHD